MVTDETNEDAGPSSRWAEWWSVGPGEVVGLAVLLLGALVLTTVVVVGAGARPGAQDLPALGGYDGGTEPPDAASTGTPIDADGHGAGPAPGLSAHDHDHAPEGLAGTGLATPGPGSAADEPELTAAATPPAVVVHVTGGVQQPGLVTVSGGARVGDVVEEAGGPSADALMDRVNLARLVEDGEHVHVPTERDDPASLPPLGGTAAAGAGGGGASAGPAADPSPIDLNHADAATLETLPGIGPARAEAIIQHREEHGPFVTPGDLRAVSGIGEATFQRLSPLVTVG